MPEFSHLVTDDEDHEELYAEVNYGDECVALITQEQGLGVLQLELQMRESGEPWSFDLTQFQEALRKAADRLSEMRRVQ